MNPTVEFGTILDNRVKDIFPVTGPRIKEEFREHSTKIDDKQRLHTLTGVTGLSMGEVIADGQVPYADAPIQGFTKTYTQQIFSKRLRLSRASMYYLFQNGDAAKIKGDIETQVMDVKDAIVHAKNYYVQAMFYGAYNSSVAWTSLNSVGNTVNIDTTSIDGVAAFSTTHPREDGGASWSNIIVSGTNNPTFSFTALLAARAQHILKKDGRGLPITDTSLNTFVCLQDSQTFFLAQSIKKTLTNGKYPSVLISGGTVALTTPTSLVDGNPTEAFEIKTFMNYGSLGWTSLAWMMYDSRMIDARRGLLHIESMPLELIEAQDVLGGLDYVKTAIEYCTFGFGDMRPYMFSNGLNA